MDAVGLVAMGQLVGHCGEQRLLGTEPPQDGLLRDVGLLRHVVQRHLVVPVLQEQLLGGVEDAPVRRLRRLGPSPHRVRALVHVAHSTMKARDPARGRVRRGGRWRRRRMTRATRRLERTRDRLRPPPPAVRRAASGASGDRVTPPWYVRRMTDLPARRGRARRARGRSRARQRGGHADGVPRRAGPGLHAAARRRGRHRARGPGHRHGHRCRAWSSRCGPSTRAPSSAPTCSSSPTGVLPARDLRVGRGHDHPGRARDVRAAAARRARAPRRGRRAGHGPLLRPHGAASCPIGLGRDGEPLYLNLEFLDGRRGAHVNISGISGVATKTTYATFLLYSLFTLAACSAPRRPTPRRSSST